MRDNSLLRIHVIYEKWLCLLPFASTFYTLHTETELQSEVETEAAESFFSLFTRFPVSTSFFFFPLFYSFKIVLI